MAASGGCTRPLDPKLGVLLVFDIDIPFLSMVVIDNNSQLGRSVYERSIQQTQETYQSQQTRQLILSLFSSLTIFIG